MNDQSTYPVGLRRGQASSKNARLKAALTSKEILMAPGCFDCVTAKLVAKSGLHGGLHHRVWPVDECARRPRYRRYLLW